MSRLPKRAVIQVAVVDLEEVEDALSDKLSDLYGFCHNGFNFAVKTQTKKGDEWLVRAICTDIDWDLDD